jgi:cell division protein FtsZ
MEQSMKEPMAPEWYVIGYLRAVPDERTFVFPVVQNAHVTEGRAYYALNGTRLEFVEPSSEDSLIRILPIEVPGGPDLQGVLPIFGYEYGPGLVWLGDAQQISKVLIDFACTGAELSASVRREISDFVNRVIAGDEFVARTPFLIQGHATISERQNEKETLELPERTRIKVIGVGGGGGNVIEHMIAQGVQGLEFICANTDVQALQRSNANQLLQLGSSGLGAGARPEVAKAAAEEVETSIRESIKGADMLFITAGMGGGTGTGAAPVIARLAKEMGILTVGVVTEPFEFEGMRRAKAAALGLVELEATVDSLIVVPNEKLLDVMVDDVTQDQAFAQANAVLTNAIAGISDIILVPGLVNVDFEDVKTILGEPGKARIGVGQAAGSDRAAQAAEFAVSSPLFGDADLSAARGLLVLIVAGRNTFKLSESRIAMNIVKRYASEDAHIIYGTGFDDALGDSLKITVLATGLPSPRARARATQPMPSAGLALLTGTDGAPSFASHPLSVSNAGGRDSAGVGVPSIWRHVRISTANIEALTSNGMDEIQIPAFLRKQRD